MQMTLSPGATSLQQRRAARGDAGVDRSGDPLGFGGVEGPRHVEIARDFEGVPDERAAFFIYEGSGLATSRDCRVSMQGMGGARGRGVRRQSAIAREPISCGAPAACIDDTRGTHSSSWESASRA